MDRSAALAFLLLLSCSGASASASELSDETSLLSIKEKLHKVGVPGGPIPPQAKYDLNDLDPMEKEIEYDNKEDATFKAKAETKQKEEQEAKVVEKSVTDLETAGPVASTIIQTFHTALQESLASSHSLNTNAHNYGEALKERVNNGTEAQMQAELQHHVEISMDLFGSKWDETIGHLIPAVVNVTRKLKAAAVNQPKSAAMLSVLDATLFKKRGFEIELKKAKKTLAGLGDLPQADIRDRYTMLLQQLKKARGTAKDFTAILDKDFGDVIKQMPGAVGLTAPSLTETQKKQAQASFASLGKTQKQITAELRSSYDAIVAFISGAIDKCNTAQEEEKAKHEALVKSGSRRSTVFAAMTTVALAATLVGF